MSTSPLRLGGRPHHHVKPDAAIAPWQIEGDTEAQSRGVHVDVLPLIASSSSHKAPEDNRAISFRTCIFRYPREEEETL